MTSLAVAGRRIQNPLRTLAWAGIVLGLLAAFVALPPVTARSWVWSLLIGLLAALAGLWAITRGERRFGWYAIAAAVFGFGLAYLATRSERRQARDRRRLVGALRGDAPLRDAADLRRARRDVLRALRRREHRSRGDDADGRLLRDHGGGQARLVAARPARGRRLRRGGGAPPRDLGGPPARRPDHQRLRDQLPRARPDRLPLHRHLRPGGDADRHPEHPQRPALVPRRRAVPRGHLREPQPHDLDRADPRPASWFVALPDAARAPDPRGRRASARRGHGRDRRLPDPLRRGDRLGDARRGRRGVPLDRVRRTRSTRT